MATLDTEVTNRYSATYLIAVTNPDNPEATATDTDVLGYACADVESDFKTYTGYDYEEANGQHISIGVEGAISKLLMRGGGAGDVAREMHANYLERLETLRGRVTPKTKSVLAPSTRKSGEKPAFDDKDFDQYGGEPRS